MRLVPDLREVWSYINPFMLYGRHMGYRGDFEKHLAAREAKAVELFNEMEEVKNEAAGFMKVRAVWQFFEAEAEGDALHLFAPGGKEPLHTWQFKRQKIGDQLCLSDYVLAPKDGKRDHVAIFVVTRGRRSARAAEKAKHDGYYFKSHGLQALAIETAEACAEWLHRRIREDWGFPDPPEMTMAQRFTSRYRGKAIQLWVSGMPGSGGSGGDLEIVAAGRDRRATDGRIHDGSGGERERAGVSSSGLHVFQRGRRRRVNGQDWPGMGPVCGQRSNHN